MKIVRDATTWSFTYDRQNDDHSIFIIQATEWLSFTLSGIYTAETIHTSNSDYPYFSKLGCINTTRTDPNLCRVVKATVSKYSTALLWAVSRLENFRQGKLASDCKLVWK